MATDTYAPTSLLTPHPSLAQGEGVVVTWPSSKHVTRVDKTFLSLALTNININDEVVKPEYEALLMEALMAVFSQYLTVFNVVS